jgi:hypothetical protein
MYDFANSGYTTVVITAVFNAYFVGIVAAGENWGTFAWTLALSVFFVTSAGALLQPAFGQRRLAIIPQARADVVFDRGEGRSWSVGVRTNRAAASPSLTFGGIF